MAPTGETRECLPREHVKDLNPMFREADGSVWLHGLQDSVSARLETSLDSWIHLILFCVYSPYVM